MSRATWTNDCLNQQAMFMAIKSREHFLISNYLRQGNPSADKSLIIVFVCFGSLIEEVKPGTTNKGKWREIKIELGDIYCNYFWAVVVLGRVWSDGGCEILGPSSRGIKSVLYVFVHSALFRTIFWRRGYHPRICTEPDYKLSNYINCLKHEKHKHQLVMNLSQHIGCFVKLSCRPLISVITGLANCPAKVKPILQWSPSLCDHLCSCVFGEYHVCKLDIFLFVW